MDSRRLSKGTAAVYRCHHVQAFVSQAILHQVADLGLVVYHQHACHAVTARRAPAAWMGHCYTYEPELSPRLWPPYVMRSLVPGRRRETGLLEALTVLPP